MKTIILAMTLMLGFVGYSQNISFTTYPYEMFHQSYVLGVEGHFGENSEHGLKVKCGVNSITKSIESGVQYKYYIFPSSKLRGYAGANLEHYESLNNMEIGFLAGMTYVFPKLKGIIFDMSFRNNIDISTNNYIYRGSVGFGYQF